jgi:hypothetical protein
MEGGARPDCIVSGENAPILIALEDDHIVHYEKISGYQGVNLLKGYSAVRIFSPLEVIET